MTSSVMTRKPRLCAASTNASKSSSVPYAGWIDLDLEALGLDTGHPFQVHDLLSGARHTWHGARNYVQLNPQVVPAHIFRIRRRVRTERDFEYFL
jgi:starch synthase (maltosyl-transferring)